MSRHFSKTSRVQAPWTEAEEGMLRELVEQRASKVRIAAKLKRTIKGVGARATILGLHFPKREKPLNL